MATCWFCGKRTASHDASIKVGLHRVVKTTGTRLPMVFSVGKTHYEVGPEIIVPRCSRCETAMKRQPVHNTILGLVIMASGIAGGRLVDLYFPDSETWLEIVLGIAIAIIVAVPLTKISNKLNADYQSIVNHDYLEYPDLKSKLAQGWELGGRPSDI